jgi:hypothetical protein
LKVRITEESTHLAVQQLKKELMANYTPVEKVARKGGEYVTTVMIKNNTDEEEMSVSDLRDYIDFKFKFNGNKDFIECVITDWVSGKGIDVPLSKNVPFNYGPKI